MVLYLICDPFWVNFLWGVKFKLKFFFIYLFIFCLWIFGYPIILAPFVEKTILLSLNFFCTLAKNQLAILNVELFLRSPLCFIDLVSISLKIPHSNDYWSYIISLDMDWTEFSHIILLLQNRFSYSSFYAFPCKF